MKAMTREEMEEASRLIQQLHAHTAETPPFDEPEHLEYWSAYWEIRDKIDALVGPPDAGTDRG